MLKNRTGALKVALLCAEVCATSPMHAQNTPLFAGGEALDTCAVELPFTDAKKAKPSYIEAARALEEEELVYMTYDKKLRKGLYTRVFVMIDSNDDGSESMYLETTEDHKRTDGMKQSFMPKYKPASERFYDARCFDRELAAHPELKDKMAASPASVAH